MNSSYSSLIPLIEKKSNITDPQKFQQLVNVIFHDIESKDYDEVHNEMWLSLPQQYELLINDIENEISNRSELKLLDIGCGTALATELLLKTNLGNKITEVHLLDTSAKMLEKAAKRSANWKQRIQTINGDISVINDTYDVIIISSVLHHIPDLHSFLNKINHIQKPGGIFITFHDPTTESIQGSIYTDRVQEYNNYMLGKQIKNNRPLLKRVISRSKRVLRIPNYIEKVNNTLLRENIIKEPLTESEIWSITDIHVEGLPYSTGKGISKKMLMENLPEYQLLSYRTYGFFGVLVSNLDDQYKQQESELSKKNDPYGRNFCSAWIKNNH